MTADRCPDRPGGTHVPATNGVCVWCGHSAQTTTEVVL